jgi:hypothetical protein
MMRMLMRALAIVLVAASSVLAADPVQLRARVRSEGPVWVGQRARIEIDLLTPTTFASSPVFELPEIPGALIVRMEDHPTLGTEVVDGATYTIAQHDLALFAMRPGTYDIPPFTVRFASANAPGEQPVEHRLTTPALRIEARLPPGAEHVPSLISTSALTVSEQWTPEPKGKARVGDAFTRRVTRSAPDVPAMAFPPLPVTDLDGMAAYPKAPVVQDHSERGVFTGTRIDSVTYLCERPGTVTVPALVFPWWNVRTQTLETVTLPELTLHVGHAPLPPGTRNRLGAAIVAVVLLAALALWWWWDALRTARRRRREQYEASEAGCFARLERACLDGDAPPAYKALFAWLERVHPRDRPATIEQDLPAARTDAELRARVEGLEAALVAGQMRWEGAPLAAALRRTRPRPAGEPLAVALPALNPG